MRQIRNKKLLSRMAVVIRQLRTDAGLTQISVYDDTGIHIGRIESARANPTVITISALCDYFRITQSEFYKKIEVLK